MADGDVPGGNGTGGNATGGDGEDAVWLDLIARFGAPSPEPADGEAQPWPDREDLAGPVRVSPNPGGPNRRAADATRSLARCRASRRLTRPGCPGCRSCCRTSRGRPSARARAAWASGPRDSITPDDPADEHYVPPVPPPLPRLDPVTKFAWIALFGGPLYLLISTAVGSTISGLAAFLAVAAFVGGFVVLVLRMDNGRPPDSGPDDGAVV